MLVKCGGNVHEEERERRVGRERREQDTAKDGTGENFSLLFQVFRLSGGFLDSPHTS